MRKCLMVTALAVAAIVSSVPCQAQTPILRLAATFMNFDGTETFTDVTADAAMVNDGIVVYSKTVFVPLGQNTLFVTLSTTADTHDGAAAWLSCRLNGAFCTPGFGGAGATPPGWINLNKHKNYALGLNGDGGGGAGDMHDNSLYYQWCTPVKPGINNVELKLASSGPDFETGTGAVPPTVFFEAAHIYIDSSRMTNNDACRPERPTPPPPPAATP